MEQGKTRGEVRLSRRAAAAALRKEMAPERRRGTIGARRYAVLRGKIHAELDRLLSGTYTDPANARLAKLLRKHRDSVLTFLDHDAVGATNHLAGREVRPAVIARKVSAGNRTEAGAETHAVLASVLRTLRRQGRPILDRATSWSSTTFLPPKGPRPCEESRRLLKSCTPSYPHSPGNQILNRDTPLQGGKARDKLIHRADLRAVRDPGVPEQSPG